jgi:hypothetical protein
MSLSDIQWLPALGWWWAPPSPSAWPPADCLSDAPLPPSPNHGISSIQFHLHFLHKFPPCIHKGTVNLYLKSPGAIWDGEMIVRLI